MDEESQSGREHALTVLEYYKGDFKKAARFLAIPAKQLQEWHKQKLREETADWLLTVMASRPIPDAQLVKSEAVEFAPAHDLTDWLRDKFLNPKSRLYNKDHDHLHEASLGCLWTNGEQWRGGRRVLAQAEMPSVQGNRWTRDRMEWGLKGLLGYLPDFLLTFDGPALAEKPNADFCAIVEHELYHCGQAMDPWGCPRFSAMGGPVWQMKMHDIEQFVGVVRRYGAAASYVQPLVDAALGLPEIAVADIVAACGTCRR